MNILFVCTGNTCRSPMAEGYLRSLNIENINTSSCGLASDGSPASKNSVLALAEIGIDIKNHFSKQITEESIAWADKIICMSASHKRILEDIGVKNISVLGNGISDPYGGDIDTYRLCRDQIVSELDKLFLNIRIIPLEHRHINDIARLEKVCFSTPWTTDSIVDAFAHGTNFFVAENNSTVLGYAGLSAILDEGYVTNIAVFPEFRNRGVATALINKLFSFAKENRLSFISLEVRPSNLEAVTLYEKLGFKQEGRRKNFYENPKEDALILTKRFD